MPHKTFIRAIRSPILACLSIIPSVASATPQTITDPVTTAGNLSVIVYDSGGIDVRQSDGIQFAQRFLSTGSTQPHKGNFLTYKVSGDPTLQRCATNLTDPPPVLTSNTKPDSRTIATQIICNAAIVFEQRLTFDAGSREIFIDWKMTNTTGQSLESLKFSHVFELENDSSDPNYIWRGDRSDKADSLTGFRTKGGQYESVSIRGRTSTYRYDILEPNTLGSTIEQGNDLSNSVGTFPAAKAYALQWFKPTLAPNESWSVQGAERYAIGSIPNGILLVPPPGWVLTHNGSKDVPFQVIETRNTAHSAVSWSGLATKQGWMTTLPQNAPSFLTASQRFTFLLSVSPPFPLSVPDQSLISLTVSDNFGQSTESVLVGTDAQTPPPATATPLPPLVKLTLSRPSRSTLGPRPFFRGIAAPGSTITITLDGTPITTLTTTAREWRYTTDRDIPEGIHEFLVQSTDPFGRTDSIQRKLLVTKPSVLDLDGDGMTDLARYSVTGDSVAIQVTRSTDNTATNIVALGKVPALADYDGDGVTDIATIRRDGRNLIWRTRVSTSQETKDTVFGSVGDRAIIGCRFLSPHSHNFTILRGGKILARDIKDATLESPPLSATGTFIGCTDTNGDGIDEVFLRERAQGESQPTVVAYTIGGTRLAAQAFLPFDRSYVGTAAPMNDSFFALIRLLSAQRRRVTLYRVPKASQEEYSFLLPRKLVFSYGSFLGDDLSPFAAFLWQNLTSGTVTRRPVGITGDITDTAKFGKRTQLIQPQMMFATQRE